MDKSAIRQIGRYQVLDVIGQGGMGIVYRGIDASIGRTVAIKMLHGAYAEDKDLLARFYREVRSTANLQHKNIVTVYALDEFDGFPCMIMEYLEGQSMAEMISTRRPLHLVDKLGLVCQVCEGLQYAHERNIVHRDIKPANVLVLKNGVAKIVDFGIARVGMSETHTLTRPGQVIGSLYYMSPEQISGEVLDARTDIYSAGVMLYQFVTGELPFKDPAANPQATLLKILNDPAPRLGEFLSTYPPQLEEILDKAMAKSPDARYATAEEFGFELSRLQDSLKLGMTQDLLAQAKLAIDRKDWETARQQLQDVLRFERGNTEANELLQGVRQQIQRQQRSGQTNQLRSQAQVALAGHQYEEAFEFVEQARRLDPGDEDLVVLSKTIKNKLAHSRQLAEALRRGQAALYAGDLNQAQLAVRMALQIDQDHTEAQALENLVNSELAVRARKAQLQGFVDEARREISSHNFLSALRSLQQAQAIDPADSNIRELLSWAARGHEQEKVRNELQEHTKKVSELLRAGQHAEALEACRAAMRQFTGEPSLLELERLAKHQCNLLERRRAVDEVSEQARHLVDRNQADRAILLLEQSLRSFPGDESLETLLSLTREGIERQQQEEQQRERRARSFASGEGSAEQGGSELLDAFQDGLARKLPLSQLVSLAQQCATLAGNELWNQAQSQRYSAALAEFNARTARRSQDCQQLEEIGSLMRKAKGSAEINALFERARSIVEQHGKDEEIRSRYLKIIRFREEINVQRDAAAAQVSALVRSMQATQDLVSLVGLEQQVQQVSAFWIEDEFIRSLVIQASAHLTDVRIRKEQLLGELEQLQQSISSARSGGQIRLLEEQAKLISADFADLDVNHALDSLQRVARDRLQRLDHVTSQLRELVARTSSARDIAEAENNVSVAEMILSQEPEIEEASDLFQRVQRTVEERRREYQRITSSLELLIANSAKAGGKTELDLILARRRDLLKKYPDDLHFRELEMRLDTSINERQSFLVEAAAAEQQQETPFAGNEEVEATRIEPVINPGIEPPAKKGGRRLKVSIAVVIFALPGAVVAYFFVPKAVTIRTIPADTTVTVDGRACDTPCSLKLTIGKHEVVGTRPGFQDFRQTAEVHWFGNDVPPVTMTPVSSQPSPSVPPVATAPVPPAEEPRTSPGDSRIYVRASVPGATVFLDGSAVGKTAGNGAFRFPASPGQHRVRLEKSGFETSSNEMITVAKAGETLASFDLKPMSGREPSMPVATGTPVDSSIKPPVQPTPVSPPAVDSFLTVVAPAGAEIHIDQELAGHSTGGPLKSKVQPGQRTVEVFMPGYQTWSQTVAVAPGKQMDVTANLNRVPAPSVNPTAPPASRPESGITDEDRTRIQQVLNSYVNSILRRDVKLLRAVWPDAPAQQVDMVKNLTKDHKGVSMSLAISRISLLEGSEDAVVKCKQQLTYDGKSDDDNVTFYMGKLTTGWVINQIPRSN